MVNKTICSVLWITLVVGLTGCGAGSAQISTNDNGAKLMSLSVSPTDPSIANNTGQQLTATGIYSDNTTRDVTAYVTWSSSDTTVASVGNGASTSLAGMLQNSMATPAINNPGHAYAKAIGKATITATSGDASGSTTLTVTPATLVSISVTPTNPSIAKGTTQQFIATGTFSDNSTQDLTASATWSSSSTGVSIISISGLATSTAAGSATITATSGAVSGSTTLTVTAITTGSATLSWDAPTTNTDGTPLTNLAGYKIYYGTSSGNYTRIIDVGNVTTSVINNLAPGTYYFTTTAYDASGIESDYSNEVSKTLP